MTERVIAVDWSGALRHPTIWLAEFVDGSPGCLERCPSRDHVIQHVVAASRNSSKVVVGLDFAFSCPSWFVKEQQCNSAVEFWSIVRRRGDEWLQNCPHPFWGRRRRTRPANTAVFRRTEADMDHVGGIVPKSVFQLAGPGHVGTGSLRGMPFLTDLLKAGFSVWPFQDATTHLIVEIYPRILTGRVVKRSPSARAQFLGQSEFAGLPKEWQDTAIRSEDAFDAAVSACAMHKHLHAFQYLKRTNDPELLLEGAIWNPKRSN